MPISPTTAPNCEFGFPAPGPQDPTPQKVMNNIFFLTANEWERVRNAGSFDYVVVGTGFCGLAFAERTLKRDPHKRILMIERGPFFLPEHFQNLPLPYQKTLGGFSETFPWTLSAKTALQPPGEIAWQHGMVPFVGGRSVLWSSWCPRPLPDEMPQWPAETVAAAQANFEDAERLLNVIPADRIDGDLEPNVLAFVSQSRPVYGVMQKALQARLADGLPTIPSATRSMAAPLAVGAGVAEGIDFCKFSVPGPLFELVDRQAALAATGAGAPLSIITECVVSRLLQQDGRVTALDTSRGLVCLGEAQLVLAMGALPPATLMINSLPQVEKAGERFTAHFISSIVARIPRADFAFADALGRLELAAIYMAGKNPATGQQYHVQLSVLSDKDPVRDAPLAARYMPDVVATASPEQLATSPDDLVFVCAVLGEMNHRNPDNWLRADGGADPTTNVMLQVLADETDRTTWDTMDAATFQMLESVLSPKGPSAVQYWHGAPDDGDWQASRPPVEQYRAPCLVHEGSTLWLGAEGEAPVATDYRPFGVENVYVTGAGLWPTSGSWNPTLTMVALAQDLADRLTPSVAE